MFKNLHHNSRHQTFRFLLFSLLLNIVVRFVAHHLQLGWQTAAALSFGMTALFIAWAMLMDDVFLKKILLFAVVAGFVELACDRWLVLSTRTLIYPPDEPMLVCSPFYMPFAWTMVLTNIGYFGFLLTRFEPRWLVVLSTMLIGGTVIPVFEHFAKGAGWWQYANCPMVWDVPYYIFLGEALLCGFLAFLLLKIEKSTCGWGLAVVFGIVQGFWIWASYWIGFRIFG